MVSTEPDPPLKIILVEDNEHDAIAVKRELKKAKVPWEVTYCGYAQECLDLLKGSRDHHDLIVSDYSMPGMSGLDLFKEVNRNGVKLPFVILTGVGSENLAVEILKEGVDDYLIKDSNQNFLKLLPVILPEVVRKYRDRIARRQAEQALRFSEARFRDITFSSSDWIWETDEAGNYIYASGRVKDVLGYQPEELIGKSLFDLMAVGEAERIKRLYDKFAADKKPLVDLENWNLTKRGEEICLLTNGVPIFDDEKNLIGYRGVHKDITKRKLVEKEREDLIKKLKEALDKIKTLRGLIPICSECKKIRDDQGYWSQVETYIEHHSEAEFSHGICPECMKKLYPKYYEKKHKLKGKQDSLAVTMGEDGDSL